MFSRAPLHFERGLEAEACMCPQQLVQFWLDRGDWRIYRYIRNDEETQLCAFSSQAGHFSVQSSVNASWSNTSDNPCTDTRPVVLRTRPWRRFKAGSDSEMSKEGSLKKRTKHQAKDKRAFFVIFPQRCSLSQTFQIQIQSVYCHMRIKNCYTKILPLFSTSVSF